VTFTGSTEVGLELQRRLAPRNIRLETEMGGKNASVVLADADLPHAAKVIAEAAFNQTGQRCTATSRVIVHEVVRDRFVELLIEAAASLRPGSGLEATTTIGPVVSPEHRDSVLAARADARQEGAVALYETETSATGSGCFVTPAIFEVSCEMDIWRREVFGPVIALTTVDSFDAALAAANDSEYGLSAAVFTRDLRAAHRFIDGAEVGQVAVNLPTSGWDVHQPFGGWKDSGSPFKEHGRHGLRFYTRVKTVALGLGPEPLDEAEIPPVELATASLAGSEARR
jgi:acyl-CoA reductase-like NAD-dependent aldehyde dehydrogenase